MVAISVVIPTLNPPRKYLTQTLLSIRQQTFGDVEVIIVDDSRPGELGWIERDVPGLALKIVRPERPRGLGYALSLGVEQTRGSYVARVDADDICGKDRFRLQHEFLAQHPEVDLVGSAIDKIDEEGKPLGIRHYPLDHASIVKQMRFWNPICHSSVMATRNFFSKYGNYSSVENIEDYELWLRAERLGARFANLGTPLLQYRIYARQGVSRPRHWADNARLKYRYFDASRPALSVAGITMTALAAVMPSDVIGRIHRIFNWCR